MPKVRVMNPEEVSKDCLKRIGWMASVSTNFDKEEYYERVAKKCIEDGHKVPTYGFLFLLEIKEISRVCYDKETEILTYDGWKLIKDVVLGEKVATLNPLTKQVEFQAVTDLVKYHHKGKMHKYGNHQSVDLIITPNHKVYAKKYDATVPSDFSLIPSEDITVNRFYFNKDFNYCANTQPEIVIEGFTYERNFKSGNKGIIHTGDLVFNKEDFVKLLAWYLSDGSTNYNEKENSYSIIITQNNIPENTKKRKEMQDLITKLGFTVNSNEKEIKFKSKTLGKFFKDLGKSADKHIPFNLFELFDKHLADEFLEAYLMCDGHVTKDEHKYLYTTSKTLADQLQIICNIAGITSNIWIDDRTGTHEICGKEVVRNFPLYTISLSNGHRNVLPIIKKDKHFTEVEYNDFVYCVEVPNHIIYVRRNFKTLWCGNCSHELVRHEQGFYKVQRSQRYVKEDGFGYTTPKEYVGKYIPIKIETDWNDDGEPIEWEGTFLTYDKFMRLVNSFYIGSLEIGIKPEIARYALSNATHTKLHVAVNLEALMRFGNMRCCSLAQPEMQELAWEIKYAIAEVNPYLGSLIVPMCEKLGYCVDSRCCGKAETKKRIEELIEKGRMYEQLI